jgi:hypothetical protein
VPGENFVLLVDVARANFKVNPFLHGSAGWADLSDIKAAGLLNNDGVYVGAWRVRGVKSTTCGTPALSTSLYYAPTRSGKGVGLMGGRLTKGEIKYYNAASGAPIAVCRCRKTTIFGDFVTHPLSQPLEILSSFCGSCLIVT